MQPRYLPLSVLLAGALALPPFSAALAASSAATPAANSLAILPPPGLYQIDIDSTHTVADMDAVMETHVDGATGATRIKNTVRGQTSVQNTPGTGQQTNCIKPYTVNPGDFRLPQALAASCPKQTNKIIDDKTMLHTAECPGTKTTLKITRIDDKTWQYDTRVETAKTSAGPANPMNNIEQLLRMQAAHAKTAAEREEAQKQLANMPQMKEQYARDQAQAIAQMKQAQSTANEPEVREAAARALANMQQIGVPQQFVDVARQRWTRIGSCPGGGQPAH